MLETLSFYMKKLIPIHTVDAFAEAPFTGNPAAVCYMMAPRSAAWMQKVAAEMNLAETAFFFHDEDGFQLRWFTPLVEVDLCGHATLATAHIIWETELAPQSETIRFSTRSGLLTAAKRGDLIELDFPLDPPMETSVEPAFESAIGAQVLQATRGKTDLLLRVQDEATVRGLLPDMVALAQMPYRGVIVTAPGDGGHDFVSRFFGPAVGIPEDPVTGSAHCLLAPFWGAMLGKTQMVGYQASTRGGTVITEIEGDRVRLRGKAVTVVQGVVLVGDDF